MKTIKAAELPAIGKELAGGYHSGLIYMPTTQETFAIITAPRAEGYFIDGVVWNKKVGRVQGALSYFDGLSNTMAMAEQGSKIAKEILGLEIRGLKDWYMPARDELEIQYRSLKPTTQENWQWRSGENPSALPPTYPYTDIEPGQTAADVFKAGAPEAFEPVWHWSSTQYAGDGAYAWCQYFGDGDQDFNRKDGKFAARAVRRVLVI